MQISRTALVALSLIALPLLIAACGDNPDEPQQEGINFPTNSQNVWVYRSTELGQNGQPTGDAWQDTARVVGTLTRNGHTGAIIRMGTVRGDSSFTFNDYDEAPYAVEPGKLYTLVDMIDSTTFYGTEWILLADENGTSWTALDTTEVRLSDSLISRIVITGKRGEEKVITVKGAALKGREYTLQLTQTNTLGGATLSTYTTMAHYWLAPGVGIVAMREDPTDGRNGLDRVLIDYTIR